MRENSFIYKLLFNRTSKESRLLEPELFHSDNYLRPDYENHKYCPKCESKAETNREIIDMFGVKKISKVSYFQSWCRICRNKQTNRSKQEVDYSQRSIEI